MPKILWTVLDIRLYKFYLKLQTSVFDEENNADDGDVFLEVKHKKRKEFRMKQ